MKLQLAIDRVSIERAVDIISQTQHKADIVEIGTSLIKEYGLAGGVQKIRRIFPDQTLLVDLKTADEGEYEFRRAFEIGADIATVMGYASSATISACRNVAHEFSREYMIDLLEVPHQRLEQLTAFEDAIFCIHLPSDDAGKDLKRLAEETLDGIGGKRRIAIAGGATFEMLEFIKAAGFEIVVIGGSITKSDDIGRTIDSFIKKIKEEG